MKVGEITRCFRCSPSISPTVTSEQRLPGGLLLRLLVLPRAISPLYVLLSLVLKHAQLLPGSWLSWLCSSCLQDSGQRFPTWLLIVILISVHLSPLGELALTMACKIPHPCGLGWHHAKWNKSETDKHCAISLIHGA